MKWGKGPNTASWTIPGISATHLLGLEYLQWPRTPRETERAATVLTSIGEIEIQNISILGWGNCCILWIPIHLSLLCLEISIQEGRKRWWGPGHHLDRELGFGWSGPHLGRYFFPKAGNYYMSMKDYIDWFQFETGSTGTWQPLYSTLHCSKASSTTHQILQPHISYIILTTLQHVQHVTAPFLVDFIPAYCPNYIC